MPERRRRQPSRRPLAQRGRGQRERPGPGSGAGGWVEPAVPRWVGPRLPRPPERRRAESMLETMRKVSTSSTIAIVGAGATLANPGGFIPLALKEISELDPTPAEYVVEWTLFALVSLLPLALALILLVV